MVRILCIFRLAPESDVRLYHSTSQSITFLMLSFGDGMIKKKLVFIHTSCKLLLNIMCLGYEFQRWHPCTTKEDARKLKHVLALDSSTNHYISLKIKEKTYWS